MTKMSCGHLADGRTWDTHAPICLGCMNVEESCDDPLPLSPPEEERPTTLATQLEALAFTLDEQGAVFSASIARNAADRIAQLEADLAAARSALKAASAHAVALAEVAGVERPSEKERASPHRFGGIL